MSTSSRQSAGGPQLGLAVAAIGVVYGDIGTSPLYALKEVFAEGRVPLTPGNVFGILSLVFWTLTVIVSLKYVTLILRADNHGEGGLVAMLALASQAVKDRPRLRARLLLVGIFGTAIFFGDGVITPAVSVLSAVEGLEVAAPALHAWVVPVSLLVLGALFASQRFGTAAVGRFFGPVMLVWFAVLAVLGAWHVLRDPAVLAALWPHHALAFIVAEPGVAFVALGAVVLCVTGAEALYADLGHFGKRPIRLAWFVVVMPALVLNYFGQGALLLADPQAVRNPFYEMAPQWALFPLIGLATAATVIASQALISGVFSLTAQAVQLDYLPRIEIRHTSHQHMGQIYVPLVNWVLMAACIGLVLGFRTASNLAAAYGIAVTMTMAITTLIFFKVLVDRWNWPQWRAYLVCVPLLVIEIGFVSANMVKIPSGGWFALAVAIILMVQMQTWRRGRQLVAERIHRGERPIVEVLDSATDIKRVAGTAVFMFKDLGKAPPALVNNLRHNKVLHKTTLIVSVDTDDAPRVDPEDRYQITKVEPGVFQVLLTFGFMEDPDVPAALAQIEHRGLEFDPDDVTYFIGRESIIAGKAPGMHPLREHLFVLLNRGADSASRFFNLPTDRVFEVGSRVEI
jgi:KUP system potassium uptake protein